MVMPINTSGSRPGGLPGVVEEAVSTGALLRRPLGNSLNDSRDAEGASMPPRNAFNEDTTLNCHRVILRHHQDV